MGTARECLPDGEVGFRRLGRLVGGEERTMRRDKLRRTVLLVFCLALTGLARGLQGEGPPDLLDEFRKADVHRRLALLPRLTAAYREEELPPEARYLLALQLL